MKSVLLTNEVVNSYETFDKMEARAQSTPKNCLSGLCRAQWPGTDVLLTSPPTALRAAGS